MNIDYRKNNLAEHKVILILVSTVLLSLLPYFVTPFFSKSLDIILRIAPYITWHSLFELSSVVVSFSVFIITYYTYNQTHWLRPLFLGTVFFLVGLLDLFHTLTFKGMPIFFISENNTANAATTFWVCARLIASLGYVISSFIDSKKMSTVKRGYFAVSAVIIGFALMYIVIYQPHLLPAMYVEREGMTDVKLILEYVVVLLFLIAIMFLLNEYKSKRDIYKIYLCCALIISMFSEVAFMKYFEVDDIYNYLGHLYKLVAYFIIFRIKFVFNVQKPYSDLEHARNEIATYAHNLDTIVEQRTKQLRTLNQRLMEELNYAKDIQKSLLPVDLPFDEHVSFSVTYHPAYRVSGDIYDVFQLDKDNIAFYIADVSGHGVPGAMVSVYLKQTMDASRRLKYEGPDEYSPSSQLNYIYNAYNSSNFKDDVYIVMLYAVYNIKKKELKYSSAGLNTQPMIIRGKEEVKRIEIKGFPICKLQKYVQADYRDKTIQLAAGDKILFYTDGLTETRNSKKLEYSEDRLEEQLYINRNMPVSELSQNILESVFEFMGTEDVQDDITFILMGVENNL